MRRTQAGNAVPMQASATRAHNTYTTHRTRNKSMPQPIDHETAGHAYRIANTAIPAAVHTMTTMTAITDRCEGGARLSPSTDGRAQTHAIAPTKSGPNARPTQRRGGNCVPLNTARTEDRDGATHKYTHSRDNTRALHAHHTSKYISATRHGGQCTAPSQRIHNTRPLHKTGRPHMH